MKQKVFLYSPSIISLLVWTLPLYSEAQQKVEYQSYTSFPGVGRIANLCQLIQALWNLGYLVLFISVLGMFIYGGYLYVTAGVNAGKVNQAKEIFTNTIIGLILGLSVFIIINIINPGLLNPQCNIGVVGSGGSSGGNGTGSSNIVPKPGETVFPGTYLYQGPTLAAGQTYGAPRPGRTHAGVDFTPCWADVVSGGVPYEPNAWSQLPVLAFRDGEVTAVEGGDLNGIILQHADNIETRYLHNSTVLVRLGQKVQAGQEIAKVGDSGSPGVPHIHFELYQNGSIIDPTPILLDSNNNPNTSQLKTTGNPKSGC